MEFANGVQNGAVQAKKVKLAQQAENGAVAAEQATQNEQERREAFLRNLIDLMIKDGIQKANQRDSPVVDFRHPKELESILHDTLKLEEDGTQDQDLIEASKQFIKYSVKTGHPRFFNQLYGGWDQYSLGGSWLTDALNTSQYTFEVAPVFTLMEKVVFSKMLNLIGFKDGEAIFCPGGSIANMYAMNLARYRKYPEVKTKGLYGLTKPLCVFTSEKAHYSIKKGASLLGIGTDCILPVKADECGRMDPQELDKKIQEAIAQGYEPYLVNGTAGTTVLGAYDPLDKIADVCDKYGLWLHVDGAWGGSAVVSRKHRHLMKGIDRADSMTWNPHKMMGVPLQAAVFLCKHKNLLAECHCAHAKYLFQQDKFYDTSFDTGDMSVQCGRKVDCLKLWMSWKARGDRGFEQAIDGLFVCARHLADKVRKTPGFRLVLPEPECTNVCFWYIPPSMRNQEETSEWWQRLGKVAPVIKQRMTERGSMLTGYQPDGDRVNFFRMIVSNFDITTSDMDFVVEEISRLGEDL